MEPRGTPPWKVCNGEQARLNSASKMAFNPLKSRTTNTEVLQLSKKDLMTSVDCIEWINVCDFEWFFWNPNWQQYSMYFAFFSANSASPLYITLPPPSSLQKIKNLVAAKLVYNLQND